MSVHALFGTFGILFYQMPLSDKWTIANEASFSLISHFSELFQVEAHLGARNHGGDWVS